MQNLYVDKYLSELNDYVHYKNFMDRSAFHLGPAELMVSVFSRFKSKHSTRGYILRDFATKICHFHHHLIGKVASLRGTAFIFFWGGGMRHFLKFAITSEW